MKSLSRIPLDPDILNKYDYTKDTWNPRPKTGSPQVPSQADREELWEALIEMQRNTCVYCEARLEADSHIEHFAKRRSRPDLTFAWSNLFSSCSRGNCCGHFKDSASNPHRYYQLQDLIKPDSEDPWTYLVFGSDGRVSVREGISADGQKKGQKTINVLNLNASHHIPERVCRYGLLSSLLPFIEELSADEFFSLCEDEINAILPYLSAYSSAAFQHLPFELLCRFL